MKAGLASHAMCSRTFGVVPIARAPTGGGSIASAWGTGHWRSLSISSTSRAGTFRAGEPEVRDWRAATRPSPAAEYDPDRNNNFTALVTYPNRRLCGDLAEPRGGGASFQPEDLRQQGVIRGEWHAELDRSEKPGYSLEMSEGGASTRSRSPPRRRTVRVAGGNCRDGPGRA